MASINQTNANAPHPRPGPMAISVTTTPACGTAVAGPCQRDSTSARNPSPCWPYAIIMHGTRRTHGAGTYKESGLRHGVYRCVRARRKTCRRGV